jgi:FtsP/CotA-like multicopper oxidase with cupredoxin domain
MKEHSMAQSRLSALSGRLTSRVSRRALLQSSAGGAAASALAAAGALDAAADATPAAEPRLREFSLTASEFDWPLMDDVTVRVWGYNGQVPGPELRVTEGDTVRIRLKNELSVPTTIHWHGLNVPNAMDGVAGLNQAPVDPGAEFTYEFVAKPAGTRWYHSHTDPALQVPMGLYGAFIVEPRVPAQNYDRDYVWILSEWDQELTPDVAAGRAAPGPRDSLLRGGELGADFFLINGKMHGAIPPIRIAEGERILIRLIHAGAIPHPIHTHGHSFQIVATDGNPVPEAARWTKDTVLIGPSERYDLDLLGDNPGVWMVHCHIEHHMASGMMTTIWYDGHQPTGPIAGMDDGMDMGMPTQTPDPGAAHDHGATATATATAAAPSTAGDGSVTVMLADDRFQPRAVTSPAGASVTWTNKGRHTHNVQCTALKMNSGQMDPGASFTYRFDAPGAYKIVCQHHALAGMTGTVTVTG